MSTTAKLYRHPVTGEVTPKAVVKDVATAFSLVVGLAPDRQMTFQSGFEGDETDEVIRARVNRLLDLGDYLKARYEIPEAEKNLAKQRETLTNLIVDRERLDKEYESEQAGRRNQLEVLDDVCAEAIKEAKLEINVKILEAQQTKQRIHDEGATESYKSGRRGTYEPRGAVKANIATLDGAIEHFKDLLEKEEIKIKAEFEVRRENLVAEIHKTEAERDQADTNRNITVERWTAAIKESEEELDRLRSAAAR